MHAPVTQAEATQGFAVPQVPVPEHVCTPLFEHVREPGAQTPVQAPPTQAWLVHAAGTLQSPLGRQVSTPFVLLEHRVAEGSQTPVHVPFTQAELTHADDEPHAPFAPQICTLLVAHRAATGVHTPTQEPPTQA
jgi:hypothetical protein